MSKIDKIEMLATLFDAYKGMLTDIQIEIFNMYYLEDLSLAEIAEHEGKSRAAISDALKKTEEKLLSLEEKLQLGAKIQKIAEIAEDLDATGEKEIALKIKDLF